MNNRMKILLIAGAVMVLLLVAGYLKQQDRNSDGSQNSVMSIETAIEDKPTCPRRRLMRLMPMKRRVSTTVLRAVSNLLPNSLSRRCPKRRMRSPHRPLRVDRKASEEQFDAAYEEIAQNMDQIYEDGTPATKSRQAAASVPDEPVTDEATRRRQAMMRDWGVGQSSQPRRNPPGASMFRAVIHGTQFVKSGQTALFRTKEPIRYGKSWWFRPIRCCPELRRSRKTDSP